MQPFDALTMRAVLEEARPLLLNQKVEKVFQLARDTFVISLRSRSSTNHLLISAQATAGRVVLVTKPLASEKNSSGNFYQLLRKHLGGAQLIAAEQMSGERILDLVFSASDELGQSQIKILTVEIMGRHSNIILWQKPDQKILGASHVVTEKMSSQREVAAGLRYIRPPAQNKRNIFTVGHEEFIEIMAAKIEARSLIGPSLESLLISTFSGLGRSLAEEIVISSTRAASQDLSALIGSMWEVISTFHDKHLACKPAMKADLTSYTVVGWQEPIADEWISFASVNDLVESYYAKHEERARFRQLQSSLNDHLKGELEKIGTRLLHANEQLSLCANYSRYKQFGDLILTHINELKPGQEGLVCSDLESEQDTQIAVPLNPNLTASANAQVYYRQFSKARARHSAALTSQQDCLHRHEQITNLLEQIANAQLLDELEPVRDTIFGAHRLPPHEKKKDSDKHSLLTYKSSDGLLIYAGRNRKENDLLISRLASPDDLWLHVAGQSGAHVIVKAPSKKQPIPQSALIEAAQLCARLSLKTFGVRAGTKVRVMYTQCRNVSKVAGKRPGVVYYENERTIEVDTAAPTPQFLKIGI